MFKTFVMGLSCLKVAYVVCLSPHKYKRAVEHLNKAINEDI